MKPKNTEPKEFDPRTARYCESCGGRLQNPGATGHEMKCPHKK